jgi:hypothetical protein
VLPEVAGSNANAPRRNGKMPLTLLIGGIVIAAFFQPNAPRLFAAFCFAAFTLSHELFLSHLDGLAYYGSDALFELAIIILISGIDPVPRMVVALHKICMVAIVANLAGWVFWFFYLPPMAYDASFVVIYAWALTALLKRNGADVGGFTLDSWATCFRFNRYARVSGYFKN